MNLAELYRRLKNMARFGTVTEAKSVDGKALARVKIDERVTDFLPIMSFSNGFRKHWIPTLPKEQVLVISPFGAADSGIVFRSIFNKSAKEPAGANEHTEIIEYSDGTRISYDTDAKELKIAAAGAVNIICQNANVTATNTTINSTTTHNGNVTIDGDLSVTGSISDSIGSLTGHVHTGVTPGGSNTGTRP